MALSKELLEMIALLPAEDQAAMTAMMEKHEPLRSGYLRQADYDKRQNELKVERKAAADAKAAADKSIKDNDEWFKRNNAINETNRAERDKFFNETNELKAKLEIAQKAVDAGGTGAVDSAKIMSAVEDRFKNAPWLTKEQAAQIVAEETQKAVVAARTTLTTETFPAFINYNLDMAEIMFHHDKEFGEDFNRAEFVKFIEDKQLQARPPKDVYNEWVAPRREEAKLKKTIEDTEKRVRSESGVPGVGTSKDGLTAGSVPEGDGAVSMFIKQSNGSGAATSAAAAAAADELRKEGKF